MLQQQLAAHLFEKMGPPLGMLISKYNYKKSGPDTLLALMVHLHQFVDKFVAEAKEGDKQQTLTGYGENSFKSVQACKRGCSHCCHMRIAVTAGEVFTIYYFLLQQLSTPDIVGIKRKVIELKEKAERLTEAEWNLTRTPCPLLKDGICLIYPVRPFICKGYNSFSEQSCIKKMDFPDTVVWSNTSQRMMCTIASIVLLDNFKLTGIDNRRFELIGALYVLIKTPDAISGWLKGENLFDDCVYEVLD